MPGWKSANVARERDDLSGLGFNWTLVQSTRLSHQLPSVGCVAAKFIVLTNGRRFTANRLGDTNAGRSRFHRLAAPPGSAIRGPGDDPGMKIVAGRQASGRDIVFGAGQRAAIFR
jgi:hypothetical protein